MPSATRETRTLRVCRTYGYGGSRASSAGASSSYLVESVTEHDTWMQLLRVGPPHAERLIAWPDASAFDHSRRDPRGRTFHVVRDTDGRPIAGAAAFHQETRTPGGGGVQRTPSIECVVLHETTPPAVAALVSCAAGGMPALIPNLSMIDETVLRPAGLRATRSEFLAHLAGPAGHAAMAASSTNIEVV